MVHPFLFPRIPTLLKRGAKGRALYAALLFALLILLHSGYPSNLTTPVSARLARGSAAPKTYNLSQDRKPLKLPLISPRILVKKAQRQLLLFSGDKLVRTYRIGLGLNPSGDKVRQGDRRTPEGDFYIFTKNDKSAYYLSLGLSYPNGPAAERGLRDRLINKTQYDAIVRGLRAKRGPPQNTLLGGDIYIHGNGAGSDWTWGCVALENEDVRELFLAVNVGTPVRIVP